MNDLDDDIKFPLAKFCRELFKLIHDKHTMIKSIVIQSNKDNLYVGKNDSGNFKPCYYSCNSQVIDNVSSYVENNKDCIMECKKKVNEFNNKLKSFNIFYHVKEKTINVCLNRIGNGSIPSTRIFNEFIDEEE